MMYHGDKEEVEEMNEVVKEVEDVGDDEVNRRAK